MPSDFGLDMGLVHDHCSCCISRTCDFGIVEGVSCPMMYCVNGCGQKFHKCKEKDHNIICRNLIIDCINKAYGCPVKLRRKDVSIHLCVCPASILMCTVEWNRWHSASLSSEDSKNLGIKRLQGSQNVDKDLDLVCALHDQRLLLETILPNKLLQYYSDMYDELHDGKYKIGSMPAPESVYSRCTPHVMDKNLLLEFNFCKEIKKLVNSCEKENGLDKDGNCRHTVFSSTTTNTESYQRVDEVISNTELHSEHPLSRLDTSCKLQTSMAGADISEIKFSLPVDTHLCIKAFAAAAPDFMALLNDSDVAVVIDVVDSLVNNVAIITENSDSSHNIPIFGCHEGTKGLFGAEAQSNNLKKSAGAANATELDDRKMDKQAKKKKRSWLYMTGDGLLCTPPWVSMPHKEVKHVSTDTDDLLVNKSSMEWLSPEVAPAKDSLIFRMFSIIASSRGTMAVAKQLSHFVSDSSCQTVAPFLINLDTSAIGHALCSALLSSSAENSLEKQNMFSLLSGGRSNYFKQMGDGPMKMSDKLAYSSLALGSVLEALPRFQVKPTAMYSFMCGCILRRDQFASHVQNVHCEIMSGLNGWIERKCPYAAYGCDYSEPRFCPDHRSNAVVYNVEDGSFNIYPGYWSRNQTEEELSVSGFIHLPYEVHEKLLNFLDSFAIRQLSRTCTYFWELCRSRLSSRGIVEIRWRKQKYDVGTPSWQIGGKRWSFPQAFAKVNRWVLADRPSMVQHVSKCPVVAAQDLKYKDERIKVFF